MSLRDQISRFNSRAADYAQQLWPVGITFFATASDTTGPSMPAASSGVTKQHALGDAGEGFIGSYDITFHVRRESLAEHAVTPFVDQHLKHNDSGQRYRIVSITDRTGSPVLILRCATLAG